MNLQKVSKVKLENPTSYQVLHFFFEWLISFLCSHAMIYLHLMKYGHAVLLLYAEIFLAGLGEGI